VGRRLPPLTALRAPDATAGVPDSDLLARWAAGRDEAAFELLVRRHGPAVLAACRRMLADHHDADDAFQAAFLVLARKAASVARGEALAGWLHRVACRAALRLRADRAKRDRLREPPEAVEQLPAPPAEREPAELLRALDEELDRLPVRYRVAFVLCCLEGKTGEEAGRLVGCPPGTVSSRLARARERLRDRLARRGFAPAALAALLARDALASPLAVPNPLVEAVARAAPGFAASDPSAGPSGRPAATAEGVIRTMFAQKLKLLPALLAAGMLAAGAVLAGSGEQKEKPNVPPPASAAGEPKPPDGKAGRPPVVRLAKPQPGGIERNASNACVARAARQADLAPSVAGTLKDVRVNIGDRVKAGQLLAEIDAPGLALDEKLARVAVAQAEGALKEGQAKLLRAKAEVRVAEGVVKLRQAEADKAKASLAHRKKQFERIRELHKQGAVDSKIVDETEDQLRAAEGQVDAAAVGIENAKADVAVAQGKAEEAAAALDTAKAGVEGAKIGLEKARLAVAQTRIVAPFDGVVATSNANVGDFFHGRQAGAPTLFTVMQADVLRLVVQVPDFYLPELKPGAEADVSIDAYPDRKFTGKVARVGFAVNEPNQTVHAEVVLPNPEEKVRPGMTGSVTLGIGKAPENALRVPATALLDGTGPRGERLVAVYVYKNGKVRLTPVRVSYGNETEIEVASGLSPNDLVVADPRTILPADPKSPPRPEVAVEVEKPKPGK
jgi:RND family efflux transporter MFP subunit